MLAQGSSLSLCHTYVLLAATWSTAVFDKETEGRNDTEAEIAEVKLAGTNDVEAVVSVSAGATIATEILELQRKFNTGKNSGIVDKTYAAMEPVETLTMTGCVSESSAEADLVTTDTETVVSVFCRWLVVPSVAVVAPSTTVVLSCPPPKPRVVLSTS